MKVLVISFGVWILIVPSLVGSFVIAEVTAALVPGSYLVAAWFGTAFTAVALLSGPLWTPADLNPSLPLSGYSVTKLIRGEKQ
jgi:hypothetical protein